MGIEDKYVPWVRAKVFSIDGSILSEPTFEFRDDYHPDRMRFYRLSDSEFLMIQIAMTAVAMAYGNKAVCETSYDDKNYGIIGDDFIEFLDLMKAMREEGGSFFKVEEMVALFRGEIADVKGKKTSKKTQSKTKDGVAKFYWQEACDELINRFEEFKDKIKKEGF